MISIESISALSFPQQDNLFQTMFWGEFKRTCGQIPLYFSVTYTPDDGESVYSFPLIVFIRQLTDGACYAYAPRSPSAAVPAAYYGRLLEELAESLRPYLPEKCICMKYDLRWRSRYDEKEPVRLETAQICMNWGTEHRNLYKSPVDYLCPDTVIISLARTPEDILSRMRGTTRNCIRKSYRSSIDFVVHGSEMIHEWYELYRTTAERKHFFHDEEVYFERLFRLRSHPDFLHPAAADIHQKKEVIPLSAPVPLPEFHIMTAEKDGRVLSGIIIAVSGHNAYYMYAGSSLDSRELMPNYGLQWEAMRFARSRGCTQYDLMGIPPNDNSDHSMSGLFIFKTGFGGEHVRFAGTWDYPYDMSLYRPFSMLDTMPLF